MTIKKATQLGMNPGTASYRLTKDLLFHFIQMNGKNVCHRCGQAMCRETFSVEHMRAWLDSEDPIGLFFDLTNIAFSHLTCNARAATRSKVYASRTEKYKAAHLLLTERRKALPKEVRQATRRAQYQRTGK